MASQQPAPPIERKIVERYRDERPGDDLGTGDAGTWAYCCANSHAHAPSCTSQITRSRRDPQAGSSLADSDVPFGRPVEIDLLEMAQWQQAVQAAQQVQAVNMQLSRA